MPISKGCPSLELKEVFNQITEMQILAFYFKVTNIPCNICAPYRNDKNPSLGLYIGKSGRLGFIDFGTRESGGIIDLLSKCWNTDFKNTLTKIIKDIPNISNNKTSITQMCNHRKLSNNKVTESTITVKFRDWRQYDLDYWESYGISLPWLKFGDIYPITHIFLTKDGLTRVFPADKYAYAYLERKDGVCSYKIYQPFSTTQKWLNKHDSSVWDLWTQLPQYGDKLIITSSRKDALCLWENTGIPSVSLQGEGYIPKEHVVQELQRRFNTVYLLYDNDFSAEVNHGYEFGKSLSEKFNLIQLELPSKYQSKDPSDLCKNYGREVVYNTVKDLIEQQVDYYIDDLPF